MDLMTNWKRPSLLTAYILLCYVNGVNWGSSCFNFLMVVLQLWNLLKFVSSCQYSPRWGKTSRAVPKAGPLSQSSKQLVRKLCVTKREELEHVLLVSTLGHCFLLHSRTDRFTYFRTYEFKLEDVH